MGGGGALVVLVFFVPRARPLGQPRDALAKRCLSVPPECLICGHYASAGGGRRSPPGGARALFV